MLGVGVSFKVLKSKVAMTLLLRSKKEVANTFGQVGRRLQVAPGTTRL